MTIESLMPLVASALIGYLAGSIPTGYLIVRAFTGKDVRKIGSGRTGGTNVYRAAGRPAFLMTVAGDLAKGAAAVLLARFAFGTDTAQLVAGFCALVGNNWSVFLGGQGGAGVMTTLGTMLAIATVPTLLLSWLPAGLAISTRIASIGSLAAAILGPLWFALLVWLGYEPPSHLVYVIAVGLLLTAVHTPNIRRLLQGREKPVEMKGQGAGDSADQVTR